MDIDELHSYLAERKGEIRSEKYEKFLRKSKLSLDAKVVHIGGSNGKGSTAFYLTLLAKKALGKRVGTLFNSYFLSVREAIWIGGEPIDESLLLKLFEENRALIESFDLTAYEIMVFLAYKAFNASGVSLAIVECGMGGNYDPSNIEGLKTELAIITNVSLEHTEYLGTTCSEIASSISGIIAKEKPVLVGAVDEVTGDALREACGKKKTSITSLERVYLPHLVDGKYFHFDYPPFKDIVIESAASYNVINASMAIEAAKNLGELYSLQEEDIRDALKSGALPGRLERIGQLVLDSASNPAAIEALCRCLASIGRSRPVHVLFAARENENISVMLPELDDAASSVTLTTFEADNARKELGFALYTEDHEYIENPLMALLQLQARYPEDAILITGCQEFIAYMKGRL